MNHAGEIRLLVGHRRAGNSRLDQRRRRASRPLRVARRRLPTPRREILDGASATDVLVCNADDPLVDGARRGVRRPRSYLRHVAGGGRPRRRRSRTSGLDGTRFALIAARRCAPTSMCRCSAAATCRTCSRRRRWRRSSACRCRRSPRAPRACSRRRIAARWCASRAASRSSTTPTTPARPPCERALEVVAREPRRDAQGGGARRDARARRSLVGLHEACGRAAAAAGLDRLIVVGGDAAQALADAAVARRHAA